MRLSHPLYTEALRASTPTSTVPSCCARLAELLAATGARRSGDLLRLATWRLGAGDLTDTTLFVTAGHQAVTLLDFGLAERLARAALDAERRLRGPVRARRRARRPQPVRRGGDAVRRPRGPSRERRAACPGRAAPQRQPATARLGRPDEARGRAGARPRRRLDHRPGAMPSLGAKARLQLFGGNAIEADDGDRRAAPTGAVARRWRPRSVRSSPGVTSSPGVRRGVVRVHGSAARCASYCRRATTPRSVRTSSR